MTDREQLLKALLQETDRRAGAEVSLVDVVDMLDELGAEYRSARRRHGEDREVTIIELVLTSA